MQKRGHTSTTESKMLHPACEGACRSIGSCHRKCRKAVSEPGKRSLGAEALPALPGTPLNMLYLSCVYTSFHIVELNKTRLHSRECC